MIFFLSKAKIPSSLPESMETIVGELKNSASQKECLKNTHKILTEKYRGYRVYTYLKLFQIFESDVNKLWQRSGFMHCQQLNFLLRILLVKSGFFENKSIESRWTAVWYVSPHQYLCVRLDNGEEINIDVWGKAYGIEFGDFAHGFH